MLRHSGLLRYIRGTDVQEKDNRQKMDTADDILERKNYTDLMKTAGAFEEY